MRDDLNSAALPAQAVLPDAGSIVIPVSFDGHYYLNADLNGTTVRFVVNTGANDFVLSEKDAKSIGIDPAKFKYSGRAITANGQVRTAAVVLDSFAIGPHVNKDIVARVTQGDMGG